MKKRIIMILGMIVTLSVGMTAFAGCKNKTTPEKEETVDESENENKEENSEEDSNKDSNKGSGEDSDETANEDSEEASKEILKEFQAVTLTGGTYTEEDLAEKDMTIFHFWSTDCGPCIVEMPELAEFSKALPDRVQMITVCFDGSGAEEEVTKILEDAGYDGMTLVSGDGDFLTLCYAVMYTPTTVFIDSDGNLAGDVIIGGQQEFQTAYTEALNKALSESGKEEVELDVE